MACCSAPRCGLRLTVSPMRRWRASARSHRTAAACGALRRGGSLQRKNDLPHVLRCFEAVVGLGDAVHGVDAVDNGVEAALVDERPDVLLNLADQARLVPHAPWPQE